MSRPLWLYLGLTGVIIAFGFPLCQRAIILSDEGYLLQQSLDLLEGRVLYRDMDSFVAPGMWFLVAAAFELMGPSVFASRMVILIVYLGLGLISYRIVAPVAGRTIGLCTVASFLLFSVWAFPTWTFAFYSPVAILLSLAALERLLAWQRKQKGGDLLLTGILLGLAICFKQNYGVFASLGAAIGYASMRIERMESWSHLLQGSFREVSLVAIGMIGAGLPFLVYLWANGAIADAWFSLVIHPFEFAGRHDIAYAALSDLWKPNLYDTPVERLTYLAYPAYQTASIDFFRPFRLLERLHVLLYWIAPWVLMAGLLCSILRGRHTGRRIDAGLFTCVSVCGLVYFGVFPRADFNHLGNVYLPILVLAPLVVAAALDLISARQILARGLLLISVGLIAATYGGVAIYWYIELLDKLDTRIEGPRGGVLVSAFEALQIDQQIRAMTSHSREGDAVLTLPDLSMLNFLAGRRVPSKWYNLYEHHIAADNGKGVVEDSEESGVQLVLARYDNFFSDRTGLIDYAPDLASYIITHFEREFIAEAENFIVYRRRLEPISEQPFANALGHCESDDPSAEVRAHLLFSALYHSSSPARPIQEKGLLTRCRVSVPNEGGVLSFEIGYRRPHRAAPGSFLEFELRLQDGLERVELLKHPMRIAQRRSAMRQQPYTRFDLDLSPWAGQSVTLEFETHLTGAIQHNLLDFKNFAAIYRDVRIQKEADGARP